MSMFDAFLNRFIFKNRIGEIYWLDDDSLNDGSDPPDGIMVARSQERLIPGNLSGPQFIEIPFSIENRYLAGQRNNAMYFKVMSKALQEGMKPVGFLVDGKVYMPYTASALPASLLFPTAFHN